MKKTVFLIAFILVANCAFAADFDPVLHQKALAYDEMIRQWHTGALGGLVDLKYADETYTEIVRTGSSYDSTDWTTFAESSLPTCEGSDEATSPRVP